MLAKKINDISVILEIFIAETRFRCPKPIASRMAGNRLSGHGKKADPVPWSADDSYRTGPHLNP